VLIPSYRHPMAQASAIATLEQIAPGRLMVGFGTGFTGRAGMGKKPLSLASMRTHIAQVKALLRGDIADIDISAAKQMTFTGTREELRERLAQLEARGATGTPEDASSDDRRVPTRYLVLRRAQVSARAAEIALKPLPQGPRN
jgi:hypothetical protein